MLTENNFEDIGKRLYDTEADPPAEGWNKIHRELHPAGRHNGAFFKRHWWKGLFLLIPVVTYLAVTSIGSRPTEIALNTSTVNEAPQVSDNGGEPESDAETSKVNPSENGDIQNKASETQDNASSTSQENSNSKAQAKKSSPSSNEVITPAQRTRDIQPESSDASRSGLTRGLESTSGKNTKSADEVALVQKNTAGLREGENETSYVKTDRTEEGKGLDNASNNKPVEMNGPSGEESIQNKNTAGDEIKKQHNVIAGTPSDNDVLKNENKESNAKLHENAQAGPIHEEGIKDDVVEEGKNEDASGKTQKDNTYAVAPPHIATNADSISEENTMASKPEAKAEKTIAEATDEEKKSYKPWRLSAGLVPTYIYRPVQPVATDEVLITNFTNKKSNYPERIGIGFMLGGAKALNNNLSLDAALSFNRISEQISYSYSTGAVDTLLAVQQPDGSVKVNPVYVINNTEMKSKITFGNIRLGATYYFWQRARSRFNLSVFGGVDFVVGSRVEEKRNGSWIEVGSENINKMNYNLGLSGGYNMNLSKGWELTVNPMLTYYPLKNNQKQQLFSFDQRSYGLNIMISKWF